MKTWDSVACGMLVLVVVAVMAGCGGGSNGNNNGKSGIGPTAVVNGGTLASATSHWVAQNCALQVEIAQDHGFISVVTDTSGTTTSETLTWTLFANTGLTTAGGGGAQGFFWITSMTGMTGSTASGHFSSTVTVMDSSGTSQTLGPCAFSLEPGRLT